MSVTHSHPHWWQSQLAVRVELLLALLLLWMLAFAGSLD